MGVRAPAASVLLGYRFSYLNINNQNNQFGHEVVTLASEFGGSDTLEAHRVALGNSQLWRNLLEQHTETTTRAYLPPPRSLPLDQPDAGSVGRAGVSRYLWGVEGTSQHCEGILLPCPPYGSSHAHTRCPRSQAARAYDPRARTLPALCKHELKVARSCALAMKEWGLAHLQLVVGESSWSLRT